MYLPTQTQYLKGKLLYYCYRGKIFSFFFFVFIHYIALQILRIIYSDYIHICVVVKLQSVKSIHSNSLQAEKSITIRVCNKAVRTSEPNYDRLRIFLQRRVQVLHKKYVDILCKWRCKHLFHD